MSHSLEEVAKIRPKGVVLVRRVSDGRRLTTGWNLVVLTALEAMASCLLGQDKVKNIVLGRAGIPVTPGMTSVGSIVATIPVDATSGDYMPYVSRDSGGLRSIISWSGVLTPLAPVIYDTLGLVTENGTLFSALATSETTIAASESVAVEWTIALRG